MKIFWNKTHKIECDGEYFIMNGENNRYNLFFEDYFIQMRTSYASGGPICRSNFELFVRALQQKFVQ